MEFEDIYYYSSSPVASSSSQSNIDLDEIIKLAQMFSDPTELPKLTVFLDLDNTLIYNCTEDHDISPDFSIIVDEKKHFIKARPHLKEFLKFVAESFYVYIYTAGTESYAKELFNRLNRPKPIIRGYFSRNHCINNGECFIKDLNILNSDLSRTVLIDDSPLVYAEFPKNGIKIKKYMGEKDDNELLRMKKVLTALSEYKDVRDGTCKSSKSKRTY